MDNDKQIPLKFLDEAEDCCDRIESTVLGLANTIADAQALDNALRAAHSIKGGAAMMGFAALSHVAHQLEDFFKILRVRYHSQSVDLEVETLLLQGVDCLRQAIDLHRRGQLIDQTWFSTQSQPIVDRLHHHLGELRPEDEDALLSQEGDVNPAILLFESGVKEALDFLEGQIATLAPVELLAELVVTADQLSDFGQMAKLDRFIDLCTSVKSQSQSCPLTRAMPLARQALKIWRRSHSVVLLGRFEKIPDRLPDLSLADTLGLKDGEFPADRFNPDLTGLEGSIDMSSFVNIADRLPDLSLAGTSALNGEDYRSADRFNPDLAGLEGAIDMASMDLSLLQSEFANVDFDDEAEFISGFGAVSLPTELFDELAALEISDSTPTLTSNWTEIEPQADFTDFASSPQPSLELLGELASLDMPDLLQGSSQIAPSIATVPQATVTPPPTTATNRQTVRVPVEYLQQFNNVFGKLILERNAIDLRLSEIHNYTALLRKRMQQLELSNKELRQWYDRASTEGLIPTNADSPASVNNSIAEFDLLEMDRYSDLHLVSQDQIETIVQLQEVTTDIETSLQEMTQSVRSLHQTTRTLQSNVTRTQMIPFGDVVKRFPRLIRDLSVQFGKSVTLKIVGENTGIDRSISDNLSDPLIHLLRNAFDHGIEDPATRLAAGKPSQGTIIIEASQRSGETVIAISDDGGGIRLDRIRHRLQQMGLPTAAISNMTEAQLLDTIFEPGFSTATSLTELSGRGVGMDIVRTNIEQIRGNIRVKTQAGVGTTFVMRVPFTLSIIRVMLLERAGFVFAVAVDSVKEIISFQPELLTADGQNIAWQSQVIPLIGLEQGIAFGRSHRSMELPGTATIAKPTVLVVGEDRLSIAFRIDRYWGEQEVTRRSIDSLMPLTPGFGQSIILGDGRVVPLIDLIQLAGWMSTKLADGVHTTDELPPITVDRTQPDTVLVIDDSINVRRYLAVMLEREGYQVEQAKDGQEAVEKLYGGLVVQAAICDMEMPRLDGYGVLEALRSDETFEELPIMMLTSRSGDKHRQLAMNLGASAYFSKPYTEPDLLATLSSLIEARRQS